MAKAPRKIAIIGPQCAGKTTVAQALAQYALRPVTVKFAQPIYDVLAALDRPKHRLFMQEFADVAKRHFGQDVFVNLMVPQVDQAIASRADLILCDDLRYLAEADLLQETFYLVFVDAPEAVRGQRAAAQGLAFNARHNSEAELDALKYRADFVVSNHGNLEDLLLEVAQVAESLDLKRPGWWRRIKGFFYWPVHFFRFILTIGPRIYKVNEGDALPH